MKQATSTDLKTAEEIGTHLGVTGRTVLNLEKRGVITPVFRVGRVIRFDLEKTLSQLEAWSSMKSHNNQNADQ